MASPSATLREQVLDSLHDHRWPVQQVAGGADALMKLETGNWQVLFLDRRLPDLDAEELVEIIRHRHPGIDVVVLDSSGEQFHSASSVSRLLLQRWLAPERFADSAPPARAPGPTANQGPTPQAASGSELAEEGTPSGTVAAENPSSPAAEPLPGMIGQSDAMQNLYHLARLVAPRTTTVLISGATGTGKELVARALHRLSPRAARAFVVVNCAAIPEALLESELFGHLRGAFTGAVQSSPGRIAAAQGGTLFLDEVGELPLSLQAKLLRFLDQKEVQRLGCTETLKVDVRVVAATNADLARAVAAGQFRGDLYYRLSAFPLEIPPLAERRTDIVPLAGHFLSRLASESGMPAPLLSPPAAALLESHNWRGNVRELQQLMERCTIMASQGVILPHHICFPASGFRGAEKNAAAACLQKGARR